MSRAKSRRQLNPMFVMHRGITAGYVYKNGEYFASFGCPESAQAMVDILNAIEQFAPHGSIANGSSLEDNRYRIGGIIAKHCGVSVDYTQRGS
ncbi:hypothetical protein KRZ98_13370 [Sphingobium sp. AS12]|uniref:hypothetical protein n=1 Tax=Sphingobium sp. AS12 TaxID=2849495 RepID=UPI001C31B9FD|nr:hypothetical protein [Sphingobium sp. AS12]MBV2149261.1 hypothetical protein [Sphingobium sp. AS12]